MKEIFEWSRVLWNDLPEVFLLEVLFRSVIMFIVLLIALRLVGKRGVRQLSIFEVVIIISLGSAAGDPMFYEDVGMMHAIMVFVAIIGVYRLVTWLMAKSIWFENLIEGKAIYLIREGKFAFDDFKKESLSQDEFFAELRVRQVEHLGQVKCAILETNGDFSVLFYPDEEVRPGLPLLPDEFCKKSSEVQHPAVYACTFCGHTEMLTPGRHHCPVCAHEEWVRALNTRRIA
ncbi:DUF421 domain-containing protein [Parachryseolinea silvisoli]|uniref:DUF421 domain-containing protein n=1 Tax=Parachryseolinea silvisoli TaxID=2873601 RepID=UPI002265E5B7|nr:DUF421 domain-containing protein [Parachryseolinea silvisoli]MCD9017474.1 DUF421 domain-containing protein [Parachryseolinea silvisoli]